MEEREERPKVVIVTPGTFKVPSDYSSSVERVADEVSKRLSSHVRMFVISKKTNGASAHEVLQGVTHIRPTARTSRSYRDAALTWLERQKPDLIQVENRPKLVRYIKNRCPQSKVWLSLHSITFLSSKHISKAALRLSLLAADRIIVNSRFLREEVCRKFPNVRSKISINHLGVDVKAFESQWEPAGMRRREADKKRHGLAGRSIVVFAGRLLPIKGVHHLLQAWPAVIKRHPRALLLVIGSAYYGSKRLTPYVRGLHKKGRTMRKHIRFLSYCPYSEMPRYLAMADMVVVPSGKKEAFGLVNVEAMSAGAPLIASRVGGMKEIIRDGINGYFVAPGRLKKGLSRSIHALLASAEKRRRMGESGAKLARRAFTWQHTADRQLALYRRYMPIFHTAGSASIGE
jgi:spore coat protein SA